MFSTLKSTSLRVAAFAKSRNVFWAFAGLLLLLLSEGVRMATTGADAVVIVGMTAGALLFAYGSAPLPARKEADMASQNRP
jgi:hypothetical protein